MDQIQTTSATTQVKSKYLQLALWFFPAAILTWGIHEGAHWAMGELLGYDMWMTFNEAGPVSGSYNSDMHNILIALAGPLVTIVQAIIAWFIIARSKNLIAYVFVFLAFYMRAVAMGISFTSKPNDEATASLLMGLPMWVLPAIIVTFLFMLTYASSKKLKAGWKINVLAYIMASVVATLVIFLNGVIF